MTNPNCLHSCNPSYFTQRLSEPVPWNRICVLVYRGWGGNPEGSDTCLCGVSPSNGMVAERDFVRLLEGGVDHLGLGKSPQNCSSKVSSPR